MREAEVVLIVVLLVEQVMLIYEWCLLDIVGCPGRLERSRSRKMDLHRLVLLERQQEYGASWKRTYDESDGKGLATCGLMKRSGIGRTRVLW